VCFNNCLNLQAGFMGLDMDNLENDELAEMYQPALCLVE